MRSEGEPLRVAPPAPSAAKALATEARSAEAAATAKASATEPASATEAPAARAVELREELCEVDVVHAAEAGVAHARVVVVTLVVALALRGVGEHGVRLDDELELLFVAALRSKMVRKSWM